MSVTSRFWIAIAILITFIQYIFTDASKSLIYSGKVKTLVLLDDWHYLDTHSLFWDQIRSNLNKKKFNF
jgi:hypothetical protein